MWGLLSLAVVSLGSSVDDGTCLSTGDLERPTTTTEVEAAAEVEENAPFLEVIFVFGEWDEEAKAFETGGWRGGWRLGWRRRWRGMTQQGMKCEAAFIRYLIATFQPPW